MKDPPHDNASPSSGRTNWSTIILLGALALLVLIVAYFATRGSSDEDKLTNKTVVTSNRASANPEKLCASNATYDLIKRELFRRAAQLRGSDQAAFDRLSSVAVVRMDHPVMENVDTSTGGVNCSGTVSFDLPPGLAVVGGRSTLQSDVDYTVAMAADGSGPVVLLKNADAIVTPLATLAQVNRGAPQQPPDADTASTTGPADSTPPPAEQSAPVQKSAPVAAPPMPAPPSRNVRPSFDCSTARTRGEMAVCNDPGLAALDRQMAAQYSRAFADASPDEREVLRATAQRFYAYRDRCSTSACVADAYAGRMREIRDIMDDRWQPPQ
ncbi:MAG TPA: hypothetical protein VE968_06650 [Sphingomicrobium sp.]|nr:hypothetical protein [Sphingomicrobium sp.]